MYKLWYSYGIFCFGTKYLKFVKTQIPEKFSKRKLKNGFLNNVVVELSKSILMILASAILLIVFRPFSIVLFSLNFDFMFYYRWNKTIWVELS